MEPMLNIALRAARKAGDIIAQASTEAGRIPVDSKGQNDFVTQVDRAAEAIILETLKQHYPDHSYLCEESGTTAGSGTDAEYRWIIDPLDGTTNFIHGMPHFAVSIACEHKGVMQHAVVLDPMRREEFVASRGRGARLNDVRIRVSNRTALDGSLIATGFPFRPDQMDELESYMQTFQKIIRQTAGVRRAGSAALDLAYVAAGRYDGYWEMGLQPWDIAAGSLLVTEAGGLIGDFQGGHNFLESGRIVCGNPKLFKALLKSGIAG